MKERGDVEARECQSAALRPDGFTLTELLVGISLGAMLLATILPALNTAQDTMKAAVCLGNMHQWGLGFSLYSADQRDYTPYEGDGLNPIDQVNNPSAWYNVVPPYLKQPTLVQLYYAGKPPTPLTKSIWICPSATNITRFPTTSDPYFTYAINFRMDSYVDGQFKRGQCVAPATTILFAEQAGNNFPGTSGAGAAARHFGGGNFALCDGHAEWIALTNFCRKPVPGCPPFLNFAETDSSSLGDWKKGVVYHWFPFKGAST